MPDFWENFEAYVRSYLPQWQYDKDSGEPEAAVLYAAAGLIRDSRGRFARLPQKHEREYLNGWPLEAQGPAPMYAYAAISACEGREVPAQSEFYLSGDGNRLWRTLEDTRAEPAKLERQVLCSGRYGKLIPLPAPTAQEPSRLYDFRAQGGQRQLVRFLHPDAFASQTGCPLRLTLTQAGRELLAFLSDGTRVTWALTGETQAPIALSAPSLDGRALCFDLPPAPHARALLVQALPGGPPPQGCAGRALITTKRLSLPPALAIADGGICAGDAWLPFGSVPEVWRTCCLACPDALALRGGKITLSYTLSMHVQEELLPGMEQQPEYRPVMRRLPSPPPAIRDMYAEGVSWEYWNGSAWTPIPGTEGYLGGFRPSGPSPARVEAAFLWPADAAPCQVQGQSGFYLRWRVQSASGGGWLPRRCHAPEVTAVRFSAELEDVPACVEICSGLQEDFRPASDRRAPLFPALGPEQDEWWLGFDRPPSGETLRLYLSLQTRVAGGRLTAWEAAQETLSERMLEDGTDGLAHSGILTLRGLQGQRSERFGERLWWLCLRDESGLLSQGRRFPQLEALTCGAVCVQSAAAGQCLPGEPLSPLRGGALTGVTLTRSFGGMEAESDRELLRRARDRRHHLGRAVTSLDVEQILCGQLRDVVRTRCVLSDGVLCVGVLMRDVAHHAAAFSRRREAVARLLERVSALPSLGLRVEVREPNFYPVRVMAWIRPEQDAPFELTQRAVRDALIRFLHPVTGHFHGTGWYIGSLPSEMETRNFLQAAVPGAALTKLLLTVTAPDGREMDCAQVRDPFALPIPGAGTIQDTHILFR